MTAPGDLARQVAQHHNDILSIYDMLTTIQATLRRQQNRLDEIATVQDQHSVTLTGHTRVLTEHSATLDQHTATLAEHTTTLAEHGATLAEHGVKLDRIIELLERR